MLVFIKLVIFWGVGLRIQPLNKGAIDKKHRLKVLKLMPDSETLIFSGI